MCALRACVNLLNVRMLVCLCVPMSCAHDIVLSGMHAMPHNVIGLDIKTEGRGPKNELAPFSIFTIKDILVYSNNFMQTFFDKLIIMLVCLPQCYIFLCLWYT